MVLINSCWILVSHNVVSIVGTPTETQQKRYNQHAIIANYSGLILFAGGPTKSSDTVLMYAIGLCPSIPSQERAK